jgi:hypothetical protein
MQRHFLFSNMGLQTAEETRSNLCLISLYPWLKSNFQVKSWFEANSIFRRFEFKLNYYFVGNKNATLLSPVNQGGLWFNPQPFGAD